MKKFIFVLILTCLIFPLKASAIKWDTLYSPAGSTVYLDVDSITEFDNYYFYNIKFQKYNSKDFMVLTIQSAIAHPFSARLKLYTEAEYESLKGDYENITAHMTKKLEPVTYQSSVNTCYKRVKSIIRYKNAKNDIVF